MDRLRRPLFPLLVLLWSSTCLHAQITSGSQLGHAGISRETWHAMSGGPCAWFRPIEDPDHSLAVSRIVTLLRFYNFRCVAMPIGAAPPQSWGDFRNLLRAVQAADIDLWAILIPPTEGGDSHPYDTDYVKWVRVLSELSLKYSHLRGVNIDDLFMGFNGKTFTHSYLHQIYEAKQSINPHFLFIPTVYELDDRTVAFLEGCVDGVWLWWTNLERSLGFASFLENTQAVVGQRLPIYGGLYAQGTSWHKGEPGVRAFLGSIQAACQYSHGAVVWGLSLDINDPLLQIAKTYNLGGTAKLADQCGQSQASGK